MSIALLAVWVALMTSIGELAAIAIKEFVLNRGYLLRPQVVWMTTLACLLVLAVPCLVLILLKRRWSLIGTPAVVGAVLATIAFMIILLHKREALHVSALFALSLGLGTQMGRWMASHREGFSRLVRLTTPMIVATVILAGTVLSLRPILVERAALAAIPPAPRDAPNVLFLILDTVRSQSMSLYGYARPTTPNLERLAQRGMLFTRAFAPAPWTLPSHASMFTGRYPHEMPWVLSRKPLGDAYPTLAEVLRDNGYATAAFTANWRYVTHEHGLSRGFAHFDDHLEYSTFWMEMLRSSPMIEALALSSPVRRFVRWHDIIARKSAATVNTEFLNWISRRPARPFFAFLNYMDAHMPYMPPEPFDRLFLETGDAELEWTDLLPSNTNPGQLSAMQNRYDGSITYLDQQIGVMLGELNRRKLLENTIVVITSDHGETLGEHGRALLHATSLYTTELHVPLLVMFPEQVPAGNVVSSPVTLRNIAATIVDLALPGKGASLPGATLVNALTAAEVGTATDTPVLSESSPLPGFTRSYHPVAKGNMKSLVTGWLHYIRNGDGREELYDLERDPWEGRDLAPVPEMAETLGAFRISLEEAVARHRNTRQ